MTIDELWSRQIKAKWMGVHVQGKRVKDVFLRRELIARLDASIYNQHGPYNHFFDYCTKRSSFSSDKEWNNWWKAAPVRAGDCSIFTVDVFDSLCTGNPCFFNPKTGKVGYSTNLGKWIEDLSIVKTQVEWFAREFPEVELWITLTDEVDNSDNVFYQESFATLHLKDGDVILEDKPRQIKKDLSCVNIRAKFLKFRFFLRTIAKTLFPESYTYWHNYVLLNDYYKKSIISFKKMTGIAMWYADYRLQESSK